MSKIKVAALVTLQRALVADSLGDGHLVVSCLQEIIPTHEIETDDAHPQQVADAFKNELEGIHEGWCCVAVELIQPEHCNVPLTPVKIVETANKVVSMLDAECDCEHEWIPAQTGCLCLKCKSVISNSQLSSV